MFDSIPMNIAIVGAGLSGRLFALNLQPFGYQITLFEAGTSEQSRCAGLTAAGMVTPFAECDERDPLLIELGQRSLSLWPKIAEKLSQPIDFKQIGSIMLAKPRDRSELSRLYQQLQQRLPDSHAVNPLSESELATLEPSLSDQGYHGLLFPGDGHINNPMFFKATDAFFAKHNIAIHYQHPVTQTSPRTLICHGQQQQYDWVIDCRGLGGRQHFDTLRGVRGELLLIENKDFFLSRPLRLLHPRYPLYIVPRAQHQFVIGASSLECEDYSPPSVLSTLELLSAAYAIHPSFAEARILGLRANCRPALSHHQPRLHHQPGLLAINGLYRNGYALAPAVVECAIKLMHNDDDCDFRDRLCAP